MPAQKKTPAKAKAAPKPKAKAPAAPAPAPAAKPAGAEVRIAAAKGRPMLQWVGKKPLRFVTAFPAQHVETFDPLGSAAPGGMLYHGDNKEVLAHLLANGFRGKVNLVCLDPPFDSGADYVRRVTLRGKSAVAKLAGEGYTLGEQVQYTDIWANDNYLQFMYERLILLKELLANDGSLYLHCDWNKSHYLRCLLEEVFGAANLRNEIIWQRTAARSDSTTYNHIHDTLFFVTKSDVFTWHEQLEAHNEEYVEDKYVYADEQGRRYRLDNMTSPNPRPNMMYEWQGFPHPPLGWRYSKETMQKLHVEGRIWYPADKTKRPQFKRYLEEGGRPLRSIWMDVNPVNSQAIERIDYPTQKPEALLERFVRASSNPGDLILDCFTASGTTAAVAQKLGRRWFGADFNKGAIQTASKRLQTIIRQQIFDASLRREAERRKQEQAEFSTLIAAEDSPTPPAAPAPAQLSFQIHRVNDYDLQIQHNEAVALACEHIGVERTKTDRTFDGTQGKRLVKIIPFNHPLAPTDLEEMKTELKARRDEERDILLVCLGKELACEAWLAEWNRLRRKGDVPNKIEIIELRTDAKYGKFFEHKAATAKVSIARKAGELHIAIEDFISPSILERLETQAGLLTPQITDWRSMVDSVMIDPAFDGEVFNIALTDLPEKKTDFVEGRYTLPAPKGETTVAVKITDMLGEEVVVQKRV